MQARTQSARWGQNGSGRARPPAVQIREPAVILRELFQTLTGGLYPSEQRLEQRLLPWSAPGEALIAQTCGIARAAGVLGLNDGAFEGPDSLDAPKAAFRQMAMRAWRGAGDALVPRPGGDAPPPGA